MRPHEWFINVVSGDCGKRLFNFYGRPMVLLALDVIALMCSSNVKDVPNVRPKSFCNETCWTGLVLQKIGGCASFLTLRVKITSCACLDGSGLLIPLICLNPHKAV